MNREESPVSGGKSLPKVEHLMAPVFGFFVRHDSVVSMDCADFLADRFKLSQTQRTDLGNGYEPRFNKRIEFVFNILSSRDARLVQQIGKRGGRNCYQLTRRREELSTEKEESIKEQLTKIYRDYYVSRPRASEAGEVFAAREREGPP